MCPRSIHIARGAKQDIKNFLSQNIARVVPLNPSRLIYTYSITSVCMWRIWGREFKVVVRESSAEKPQGLEPIYSYERALCLPHMRYRAALPLPIARFCMHSPTLSLLPASHVHRLIPYVPLPYSEVKRHERETHIRSVTSNGTRPMFTPALSPAFLFLDIYRLIAYKFLLQLVVSLQNQRPISLILPSAYAALTNGSPPIGYLIFWLRTHNDSQTHVYVYITNKSAKATEMSRVYIRQGLHREPRDNLSGLTSL